MQTALLMPVALCLLGQVRVEPQRISTRHDGQSIVVEGVYAGLLGKGENTQLRLQHCKARFIADGRSLDNLDGNIEIVGDVTLEDTEIIVRIRSLRSLDPDIVRLEKRAAEAKDYRDWYALSSWARRRAEQYGDAQMRRKARETYLRAVAEHRKSIAGDVDALQTLSDRIERDQHVKDFDFPDLGHEILHAEHDRMADRTPEELRQFRRRMTAALLGSNPSESPALPHDLRREYEKDPLKMFREADTNTRRQLVRYWDVLLTVEAYGIQVETGKFDALQIGDLAEQEIPDYPDIAKGWYQKWIDRALESPTTLGTRDLDRLAETLALKLGDTERAEKTMYDVLNRREEAYRALEKRPEDRDANARFELAREYLRQQKWIKPPLPQQHAARLLKETLSIDPRHSSAERELRALGYDRRGTGGWTQLKDDREIKGIRNGMEPYQVERAQGGPPDAKGRLVSASGVRHQWIYRAGKVVTYVVFKQHLDGRLEVSGVFTIDLTAR